MSIYLNAPRFWLFDAFYCICLMALAGWCAFLTWQSEQIRDQVSRTPTAQRTMIQVSGNYPHLKVYPEGWDLAEPERMVEPQPLGKEKKK